MKALDLLSKGVISSVFRKEIDLTVDAMPKYLGRLRNRGIKIKTVRVDATEYFYTLETPMDTCYYLLEFGDTKMSRQTAKMKAGIKSQSDRTRFCHRESMWFILTR